MNDGPHARARTRTLGWYIHHHGRGHITRFHALRPHLDANIVVFSSLARPADEADEVEWIELPEDSDGDIVDPTAGGGLHWAPLGHPGHRQRMRLIAAHAGDLDALVVDVSMEVAAFARLLGIPTVLIGQPGDRSDRPHLLGRSLAARVINPWPDAAFPDAVGVAVGGISRFARRVRAVDVVPGSILALGGGEDDTEWTALIEGAQRAVPDADWVIRDATRWTADPWDDLCRAEVVISAAGQNAVADLAAAGARAVVVPRPRPFGEQEATVRALDRLGLAIRATSADWREHIIRARSLTPRWGAWQVDGAADRAARIIDHLAADPGEGR